jgi:hypothetical protein
MDKLIVSFTISNPFDFKYSRISSALLLVFLYNSTAFDASITPSFTNDILSFKDF